MSQENSGGIRECIVHCCCLLGWYWQRPCSLGVSWKRLATIIGGAGTTMIVDWEQKARVTVLWRVVDGFVAASTQAGGQE
jgi:hypothetical protein